MQQIIDLADVGRTTFYTHFETKDALLESFCAEIFEHVFSEELDKEKTYILACKTGLNGYFMERMLRQKGYKARDLMGGCSYYRTVKGWKE